jgi:hypothetical protein
MTGSPADPTKTKDGGVEIVHCDTLDQFWHFMSPIGEHFGERDRRVVFRGQRNSEWKLVPNVFREDVINKYKRGMTAILTDHPGQVVFEWILLNHFIHNCDGMGLSIPEDSMEFRKYFDLNNIINVHGINTNSWPEERVEPLMALAQHHGIPTRLLDWSSNPFVACYHAAASAVSGGRDCSKSDEKIALFVFDLNDLPKVNDIKHVKVPGSTSANISSQSGSFILVKNAGYRGNNFTPGVSMESKLPLYPKVLKKVTLPAPLAGELLLRCDKCGISAASVFRGGYDGVAKAVLESTLAFNFNR